jgi:hypothetical protein
VNRDLRHLLGELALVNQQVTWVALDMVNDKLPADAQIAFGERLARLGAVGVEARYPSDGQCLDAVRTAARRCAAACRGHDVAGRPGQATTP